MAIIFLFGLVGGTYLWWRFRQISNKRLFFQSSLFRSLTGCVLIIAISAIIVNSFAPEEDEDLSEQFAAEHIEVIDTVRRTLLSTDPAEHYRFILSSVRKYNKAFFKLQDFYFECVAKDSAEMLPLSHFGLGAISLLQGNYQYALGNFAKVPNKDLPFLNSCMGEAYANLQDTAKAKTHFLRELEISHGNISGAVAGLVPIYLQKNDWQGLNQLRLDDRASKYLPDFVMCAVHLYNGNIPAYAYWLAVSTVTSANIVGFIAALVISVVWIIYLYTLNVFGERRLLPIIAMFISGILSMVIISAFVDLRYIHNLWDENGNFLHDLLYFFVMVGMPEEFTKLFPILIMLAFIRRPVEPIEYIIFAAASALGFAFIENLLYFQNISGGIIHGRAYLSAMGHT